jgi:hypothetical protein
MPEIGEQLGISAALCLAHVESSPDPVENVTSDRLIRAAGLTGQR